MFLISFKLYRFFMSMTYDIVLICLLISELDNTYSVIHQFHQKMKNLQNNCSALFVVSVDYWQNNYNIFQTVQFIKEVLQEIDKLNMTLFLEMLCLDILHMTHTWSLYSFTSRGSTSSMSCPKNLVDICCQGLDIVKESNSPHCILSF